MPKPTPPAWARPCYGRGKSASLPVEHYPFYPGLTHQELLVVRIALNDYASTTTTEMNKKHQATASNLLDRLPPPNPMKSFY